MKMLAGAGSEVHFTHLSQSSCNTLTSLFTQSPAAGTEALAAAHPESVMEFMRQKNVPLNKVCLLDPKAENPLAPEDGDGEFEWFVFGVSLGCRA
jgi:ribosome biogenesis SPOUT family RNA methylase Rps3